MGYEVFDRLCRENGVTAYQVSKETGVSTATLSSWKTGRYTPKEEKLKKLADYFGVSTTFLRIGNKKYSIPFDCDSVEEAKELYKKERAKKDNSIDSETAEMAKKFYQLNKDDREEILALIDFKMSKYKENKKDGSA